MFQTTARAVSQRRRKPSAPRRSLPLLLLACTACAALHGPTPARAQVSFSEESFAAGVSGDTYLVRNNHGLGVNWIDFDDDGWPDIFTTNGYNRSAHLFHNNQDGTFTRADYLLPALPIYEQMGSVFADFDNDGDSDIYIFTDNEDGRVGPESGPPNLLLENLWDELESTILPGETLPPSGPLFDEVAVAAGVDDLLPGPGPPPADGPAYRAPSGAWLDYDRDGWVDLYVCHWAPGWEGDDRTQDRLYRNLGDGTFADVTATSGLDSGSDPYRSCLATLGAHLDDDLWPDLYVVNVETSLPYQRDMLYQNQGPGGSTVFVDEILMSTGMGDDSASGMGVTTADTDLDGDWDLYISDLEQGGDAGSTPGANPYYEHTGTGVVYADDSAAAAGIVSTNSWGVNFFDADNDRYEDLFVATMAGATNQYYENDQAGAFVFSAAMVGAQARGSAFADYDRDGDLDIAVVLQGGALRIYRNNVASPGNWLQVDLDATLSNRDAIGTLVKIEAGGDALMRQVLGGSSAHSQDDLTLHFGLGPATSAENVTIYWPSGIVDTLPTVAANQRITVAEGSTHATVVPGLATGLLAVLGVLLAAAGAGILGRARFGLRRS